MTDVYDLLVIGAGAAGGAAAQAANNGARVVQIERDKIGGTCLNYGCDPTKTLLRLAQERHKAKDVATACTVTVCTSPIFSSKLISSHTKLTIASPPNVTRLRSPQKEKWFIESLSLSLHQAGRYDCYELLSTPYRLFPSPSPAHMRFRKQVSEW